MTPAVTVIRGNPTEAEVAAVVVALLAVRSRGTGRPATVPADGWVGYWRGVRRGPAR